VEYCEVRRRRRILDRDGDTFQKRYGRHDRLFGTRKLER
jgi:hypothetical protein